MHNSDEFKQALLNAQKASAAIKALRWAWIEMQGSEVELMLEMSSQHADQVTEYLINQSAEDNEDKPE